MSFEMRLGEICVGVSVSESRNLWDLSESRNLWDSRLCAVVAHNLENPIHNLWDKKVRNLWDPSIICGTAPQTFPFLIRSK